MRLTIFLYSILLSFLIQAQPSKYGCHHTHKHIQAKELSPQQKVLLNNSNLRSDTFNILHYDIHLDITDYSGQYIKGNTLIDVNPLMDDLETITLDLYGLTVDSVKLDGQSVTFSHDPDVIEGLNLQIQLPAPSVTDEDFQLSIWYQGEPHQDPQWGGFYFESNYIYNLGIGLSTIPPNFGKVWYPCFDTFVERASYDFRVLSDDGFIPRCQGELMSETPLEGDSILSHYHLSIPIPTYLSAIAASQYVTIAYDHEGAYGTVPVELQCKQVHEAAMEARFQNLPSAIDALEYWFGPYIWNKVGYVMTTVGAMEHATNIAYPQGMMNQNVVANDGLLSHELGHLWWGDITSPESHNHMWLKEGHAEYSQHLMREWHSGHDEFIAEVKSNQEFVLESAHADDEGFFPLSPIPDEVIYGRHTYYKGAAQVHSLRGYLGDSLFRVGAQAVLDTFYLSHMGPEDYKNTLSEVTGVDLTDFFEDHIYSPGFSTFIIDSTATSQNGETWTTTLYLQQKLREAPHFYNNVPLEIGYLDENWDRHSVTTLLSGEFNEVVIETLVEPLLWMLNGENKINQAKLDYEGVLFETTNTVSLPWVDFKVKVNAIVDTAFLRVEHHWVGADDHLMDEDVLEISGTHYWTVGGIWSPGLDLTGRATYTGVVDTQLDYDLVGETEVGIAMVYRTDASDPWSMAEYQTIQDGGDNGNGQIKIDSLYAGEYAFAKVDMSVGIDEWEVVEEGHFELYPNPAQDMVQLKTAMTGRFRIVLLDAQGRVVMSTEEMMDKGNAVEMDIHEIASGQYQVLVTDLSGKKIQTISLSKP